MRGFRQGPGLHVRGGGVTPLCVIPARAGSKRLPGKNLRTLGGKPILAWTVEAALRSGIFGSVYVSSEDERTLELARGWGAATPFVRPKDLAGDTVTNVAVALHQVDELARAGLEHDAVVCLQPSSPLRSGDHIRGAWDRFLDDGAAFLASVTPIDPHYFHWAMRHDPTAGWGMYFGDAFLDVRQNLPAVFRPNGAIKIARIDALREAGTFFGAPMSAYEMPEENSIHVATRTDLIVAEALMLSRVVA